jgi:DNA polymerase-1
MEEKKNKVFFIGNDGLINAESYVKASLQECIDWLSCLEEVNLDTETEGHFDHRKRILMLQLNWQDTTYVIDTRVHDISVLKRLEDILVVGQNLKFDYKFLKFHGITLNRIYDTMLAECCLTNGYEVRSLGLAHLADKYCGIKLNKSVRGQFTNINGDPFTEQQIMYGVGDVTCLTQIKEAQLKAIAEKDMSGWVQNEFDSCLALADIEYNGMGFDKDAWIALASNSSFNAKEHTDRLDDLVRSMPQLQRFVKPMVQANMFAGHEDGYEHERDVDIMWSSPSQVDKVFKALGLNLESTSERFLSKYQNKYPLVKHFIDYKKEQKLVTTYGLDFLDYVNPNTDRIHTVFWQMAETSRVTSGSKEERAPNMQNIPAKAEYRNCFVPRTGFKMVSCDFSGQELRLCAEGSQEPLWLDAFNNGEDLHSKVASMVFKVSLEEVRDKPEFLRGKSYRDAAKTVNFGLIYGMSKFKLADTLSIEVKDADKIIKDYFKATGKLNEYLNKCRKYGMKYGYIRSFKPYSIIRWFPKWEQIIERDDFKMVGEIERASMNTPIQASGAQMVKRALHLIRTYIRENNLQDKVYIVMTVHDQIDCEVQADFAEEWSLIQQRLMQDAGAEIIKTIPVLSDITISDAWTK